MKQIDPKDLVVGQLCWYLQYMGDSMPASQDLVAIVKNDDGKVTVQVINTGQVFEADLFYAKYEEVSPQYLQNKIKALEDEQLRIAEQLKALKSFV